MIRSGEQYKQSIRDGRVVYIDGERVQDVTTHPSFKPLVDIRARIYDMAHDPATREIMAVDEGGERFAVALKPPRTQEDWHAKRRAVDRVTREVGGVVTRVGDETVGEMWSLADGKKVLNEIDPRFSENIERHIAAAYAADPFHVSANTDPKGDRSKRPQDQDPDFLVHVVKETDAGIVIRGAKYETAAAYSNQAFLKPTIANWGDAKLSDYAVGCILRMAAPGVKHICRSGFAGRTDPRDYPLSNRCDEIDTLVILDNVLIPWEDILFYRHTGAASFIRATLHRYSAFPYVQRTLTMADLMIGVALWNARQTGLDKQQAVQEKLAELAVWREGINAHLTAAISMAEPSENGFLMPNQSLLFTGRYYALSNLPRMMHLARELCGGQICVTPNVAAFEAPETRPWLEKYYSINESWLADDRRKLLAFARDLLNSDYAGHRLTFQLFAQAPPFAHLAAVYRTFDWPSALELTQQCAGLSDRIWGSQTRPKAADEPSARIHVMKHTRIRPFNTRDTYPEQKLDNDLCQAVVARGRTVFLRGQVGQDLDTGKSVGIGDAAAQADQAMRNIKTLLAEAGAAPEHICKIVVYITDPRYREAVYRTIGGHLKGVFPVSTGLVISALARPEWVVEVDATAVIPD